MSPDSFQRSSAYGRESSSVLYCSSVLLLLRSCSFSFSPPPSLILSHSLSSPPIRLFSVTWMLFSLQRDIFIPPRDWKLFCLSTNQEPVWGPSLWGGVILSTLEKWGKVMKSHAHIYRWEVFAMNIFDTLIFRAKKAGT